MTDVFSQQPQGRGRRRVTKKKSRLRPLLSLLVVIGLLSGGAYVIAPHVLAKFQGPADFSGASGSDVQIQVTAGQTLAQIGNSLKAAGVVASVDAFTQAAAANPKSATIGPGVYSLPQHMSAQEAVAALLDPTRRVTHKLVVPEGKRASWILDAAAKATGLELAQLQAAAKDTAAIGLPDFANGNLEGFLFPATYEFAPNATATQVIKAMVDKYLEVASATNLETRAKQVGLSPYQVITIASLLEVEGHPRDFGRVARVVYNRLSKPMRLEFDSTVNYGLGKTDVILTDAQLKKDTRYNTYLHDGLPPTPIDNPGQAAIEAALSPVDGNWLYFITVDLGTQETKFTADYQEFLGYKQQFLAYCSAHPGTC